MYLYPLNNNYYTFLGYLLCCCCCCEWCVWSRSHRCRYCCCCCAISIHPPTENDISRRTPRNPLLQTQSRGGRLFSSTRAFIRATSSAYNNGSGFVVGIRKANPLSVLVCCVESESYVTTRKGIQSLLCV